jgi:hypothetical protein
MPGHLNWCIKLIPISNSGSSMPCSIFLFRTQTFFVSMKESVFHYVVCHLLFCCTDQKEFSLLLNSKILLAYHLLLVIPCQCTVVSSHSWLLCIYFWASHTLISAAASWFVPFFLMNFPYLWKTLLLSNKSH